MPSHLFPFPGRRAPFHIPSLEAHGKANVCHLDIFLAAKRHLSLLCTPKTLYMLFLKGTFCFLNVTKNKFLCSINSEAKQTKTLECGAEKCLLKGHAEQVTHAQTSLKSEEGFPRVCDQLVHSSLTGWC